MSEESLTSLQWAERDALVYPNRVSPVVSGLRKYRAAVEDFVEAYRREGKESIDYLVEQLLIDTQDAENQR